MAQPVIALVDDDPHTITLLHDLLGDEGYRTFAVTDGPNAPAAIMHAMPDLVILDLWMERQDTGWEIYDALRADDATARIPVLVCSADIAALHARAAALNARGDAAIEKPFNIIELLALVDRLLAGSGDSLSPAAEGAPALRRPETEMQGDHSGDGSVREGLGDRDAPYPSPTSCT